MLSHVHRVSRRDDKTEANIFSKKQETHKGSDLAYLVTPRQEEPEQYRVQDFTGLEANAIFHAEVTFFHLFSVLLYVSHTK